MIVALFSAALAQSPEQIAADAAPLPLYRSAADIHAALVAADWQPCADTHGAADAAARVSLALAPEGALSVTVWDGIPAPLAGCWAAVVASIAPMPHREETLQAQWSLVLRGGVVYPSPVVRLEERAVAPLFLFVAPDATPAQRAALLAALGMGASGPARLGP